MRNDAREPVLPRSRPQVLAAGLLALGGGAAIVYAGLLPIPPFSDVPVPLAMQAFGVVGLAAALGVFLGQAWGRALGVVVVVVDVALAVFRAAAQASGSGPLNVVASLALSVVLDAIVLWVLLRRLPPRA
jgi:hypothetical protein